MPDSSGDVTAEAVHGTWHIVATSLPFWRRRQNPSVTYAPLPDGRILDVVRYTRRGRVRLVIGVDEPLPDGGWRWRGLTPLTRLASSEWRVLHATPTWAITHFTRTPFTPEGIDVYVRALDDAETAREHAAALLPTLASARPFIDALFTPTRN